MDTEPSIQKTAPSRAWAKTDRGKEGNPKCKTIKTHGMETGLIARQLIPKFLPELTERQKQRVIWLAENHDVGKATPLFQSKVEEGYKKDDSEIGHQILSSVILRTQHNATLHEGKLVGAHHGTFQSDKRKEILEYPEDDIVTDLGIEGAMGGKDWRELQLKESTLPTDPPLEKLPLFLSGRIAGLITLCDHIASSLNTQSNNWINDLSEEESQSEIYRVLKELSLGSPLEFYEDVKDFQSLTGKPPRQFQNLLWRGKGVYLLEAPTGSGKTEAALSLLLQATLAKDVSGGYIGLPTTLTSNMIFERLCQTLQNKSGSMIQLSHGKSWIQKEPLRGLSQNISYEAYNWLCNRSLSAALGVGTIDQALMGTINTKHWPLRGLMLHNKLIICDEVHGYDHYTTGLIGHAIENWVKYQDCSVLCLSATLNDDKKRKLLGEDFPTTKDEFGFSYLTDSRGYETIEVGDAIPHPNVTISPIMCDTLDPKDDAYRGALEKALDCQRRGLKTLFISNSIQDSQTIASINKSPLLHSRFTVEDRAQRENRFIEEFTKDAGMLLVGTQVLEQSLDIDADIIFTELCPIELLIQRMGRLWRKNKTNRVGKQPIIHVLAPKKNPSIYGVSGFGRTAKVYRDHFQLIRAWYWVTTTKNFNKGRVRSALSFHQNPETEIEKEQHDKETVRTEQAKTLADAAGPRLCSTNANFHLSINPEDEIEGIDRAATTRVETIPFTTLCLFRTSRELWNGYRINDIHHPTGKDWHEIEKNSVRVPIHLLTCHPKTIIEPIKRDMYQWISDTEFDYGVRYENDLGIIKKH
jgi:CRISPR-associated endonuclease/helicase Cas3